MANAFSQEIPLRLKRKFVPFCCALSLVGTMAACSHSSPPAASNPAAGQAASAAHQPSAPLATPAVGESNLWKSETTGKEYRVIIKGDRLVADWVNLPPIATQRGSYIHTVCKREGSKWVGTASIFMACTLGEGAQEHIANTCHLKMKMEFDTVTNNLIAGRGQGLGNFDCRTCKALATGWGNFKWVPVR
jgi:hypothetical protein